MFDCNQSRRQLLQSTAVGFGGVALASMMQELAAADQSVVNPFHFAPRAKRVIFMFMKGGPSQVDTFDYKPRLQQDDGKPFPFDKPRVQFAPTGNLLGSHLDRAGFMSVNCSRMLLSMSTISVS